MATKILVTGASGFLGWNFCKAFAKEYTIVGTYFRNQPDDLSIEWVRINLLETPQIIKLIKKEQPDLVIHLAAIANASFCEQHPALSHHINVYTTIALAEASKAVGVPMIFASTDLVFNGNSAPYAEDDFSYPLSQYGQQKQMAEEALLGDFEHVFVVRFPLMFGAAPAYSHNFFTTSLTKLQDLEPIQVFTDEYRTMISGQVASEWLHRLISYCLDASIIDKEHLFHLGGSERLSRYDWALKMATVFELEKSFIEPVLQKDLDLVPARPADVSLDSSMAMDLLDFTPPSVERQFLELKEKIAYR